MADAFEIVRDERGRFVLRRPGQEDAVGVRVRRAFLWSNPGRFVSVRSSDGQELLLLDDLAALDPGVRQGVEQALAETSFIPRIKAIRSIDTRFEHHEWTVETDRGPTSFRVQEREDVRFLGDGRFRIKDADGNVYELPRVEELDENSRREVEKLV